MERIRGTVADIWTDNFSSEEIIMLCDEINAGNATVVLNIDATALGFSRIVQYLDYTLYTSGSDIDGLANSIGWDYCNGEFQFAYVFSGGEKQDVTTYGSMIPMSATIYWHPMPT